MRAWMLCVCSIWFLALAAHADDPASEESDSSLGAARKAYSRGEALYRAGHYEAAQVQFEEAYASTPNPVVLLGIAKAQEKQGQIHAAVLTLERYLKEQKTSANRGSVERHIQELRSEPAVLLIKSDPPGARLLIDGKHHQQPTPTEVRLTPGTHRIEVRAEGHFSVVETLHVQFAERRQVGIALRKAAIHRASPDVPTLPKEAGDTDDADDLMTATWVALGIAGGALVVGSIFGILTLAKQHEFNEQPTDTTAERGEGYALGADVSLGIAAGAGITALVLYLTREEAIAKNRSSSGHHAGIDVIPTLSSTGGGLSARVSY